MQSEPPCRDDCVGARVLPHTTILHGYPGDLFASVRVKLFLYKIGLARSVRRFRIRDAQGEASAIADVLDGDFP